MVFKKGISPVVAIALLLVVAVVAVVGFQNWYSGFQSNLNTDIEVRSSQSNGGLNIEYISDDRTLYVTNPRDSNVSISNIKIGDNDCSINQNLSSGVNPIDISSCFEESEISRITLITENGIVQEKIFTGDVLAFDCTNNILERFYAGSGTLSDPWQICNCNQLQNMVYSMGGNYSLKEDIDCIDTKNWNSGMGFMPIGNISVGSFNGIFEGNNYVISNLYINRNSNFVGLFGYVNIANISNIVLNNVNLSGIDYVGALAGFSQSGSNFINCIVSGKINAKSRVGGMVGYLQTNSNISKSYSNVDINATQYIGGLVGFLNGANINNSYSIGQVNGTDEVGGLVARQQGTSSIVNSYSIGKLKGDTLVGGLIANQFIPALSINSYWDNQTSTIISSSGDSNNQGRLTIDMKIATNFIGWDFTNLWTTNGDSTYPEFK